MQVSPSRIARTVAGRVWPDVQVQHKLAKGVFAFSCAGHGGVVAVIGEADLPDFAVQAAREAGLVETVVFQPVGRKTKIHGPSTHYRDLVYWGQANNFDSCEVWIGEEDCDWATVLLHCPAAREVTQGSRHWLAETIPASDCLGVCERWNADFLAACERLAA